MKGLLADANIEGHALYLRELLEARGEWSILTDLGLSVATLADIGVSGDIDDRSLWNRCQRDGWILFTDSRNDDGVDSLQSTLADSWQPTICLPVFTITSKSSFQSSPEYRELVAKNVADLLFDIWFGAYRDRERIYVPL